MNNIVNSINKVPIRLTHERWNHIVENHIEMAGYYYDVLEGDYGKLLAIKPIAENKYIIVIYRENKAINDGFIITAFISSKIKKVLRRKIIWQQKK